MNSKNKPTPNLDKLGRQNRLMMEASRENRMITMFKIFLSFGMLLTDIYSNEKNMADTGAFVMYMGNGSRFLFNPLNSEEENPEFWEKLAKFSLPKIKQQKEFLEKRHGLNQETLKGLDKFVKLVENSGKYDSKKFVTEYEKILLTLTERRENDKDYKYDEILNQQVSHCIALQENSLIISRLKRLNTDDALLLSNNIIASYNTFSILGRKSMDEQHDLLKDQKAEKVKQAKILKEDGKSV